MVQMLQKALSHRGRTNQSTGTKKIFARTCMTFTLKVDENASAQEIKDAIINHAKVLVLNNVSPSIIENVIDGGK